LSSTVAASAVVRGSSGLAARLETHFEAHIQRSRQPFQHQQGRNGPAGLEPSDRGLRHSRCLCQSRLAPTPALAKLPKGTTELKRQPRSVVRLSGTRLSHPPLPNRGPTATFAHDLAFLIHNLVRLVDTPRQLPARPVYLPLVPRTRLVETVNRMILLSVAIQ
jgi:hypothetical protein